MRRTSSICVPVAMPKTTRRSKAILLRRAIFRRLYPGSETEDFCASIKGKKIFNLPSAENSQFETFRTLQNSSIEEFSPPSQVLFVVPSRVRCVCVPKGRKMPTERTEGGGAPFKKGEAKKGKENERGKKGTAAAPPPPPSLLLPPEPPITSHQGAKREGGKRRRRRHRHSLQAPIITIRTFEIAFFDKLSISR